MKHILCLLAAAFLSTLSVAAQIPLLYYDFEQTTGTTVTNKGSIAINGTLNGVAGDERWVAGAPAGASARGGLELDGDNGADGDNIDTGMTSTLLGLNGQNYTASCWVNFQANNADRFVFGQLGARWLHLGIRGSLMKFGHYGADTEGTTIVTPNTWHHLTFLYVNGAQLCYLDGVRETNLTPRAALGPTANLIIGRAGNNSSVDGVVDEVVIWDSRLTENQIEYLAGGGSPLTLPPPQETLLGEFFTAPFGPGGTWNLYYHVADFNGISTNWWGAHERAISLVDPRGGTGKLGHLAHVHSVEENRFLRFGVVPTGDFWIGLTDSETFGGTEAGGDPTNGWVWASNGIDAAPAVTFTDWLAGEPNDANGEDAVLVQAEGFWNDDQSDIPADAQPGGPILPYVVEWETQSATPVSNATVFTTILPPDLPGANGTNGCWSSIEWQAGLPINTLHQALDFIQANPGNIVTSCFEVINFVDPQNFAGGGRFQKNESFENDANGDTINFIGLYKARVTIPSAGAYTFGVRADDGFALRIRGHAWSGTSGMTSIDPLDPETIFKISGQGAAQALGVINLPAGEVDIEFVSYESTGAAFWELFSAPGAFTDESQTTDWRLVGYEARAIPSPGMADQGGFSWSVWGSAPGGNQLTTVAAASNEVYSAAISTNTTWDTINFHDPDNRGGGGAIQGDVAFPINAAGDDNDFAIRAFGLLDIPIDGFYQIGMRGDDGGAIRIPGQSWTRLVETATGTATLDGDTITCDCVTANSRMVGEIFLTAGQHPIDALFFERAGGAYYEIFHTTTNSSQVLLATGPGTVVTDTIDGLLLVRFTTHVPFAIRRHNYAVGDDTFTLIWESVPGASYVVEFSDDYVNWMSLPNRVASQGTSTTTTIDDPGLGPFTVFRVGLEEDQ